MGLCMFKHFSLHAKTHKKLGQSHSSHTLKLKVSCVKAPLCIHYFIRHKRINNSFFYILNVTFRTRNRVKCSVLYIDEGKALRTYTYRHCVVLINLSNLWTGVCFTMSSIYLDKTHRNRCAFFNPSIHTHIVYVSLPLLMYTHYTHFILDICTFYCLNISLYVVWMAFTMPATRTNHILIKLNAVMLPD